MIGYVKKAIGSVSGWEKSHFGGFYRMITDYPFIKLDFDVKVKTPVSLDKALGWYTGEKLIKLYLLKNQAHIHLFRTTAESVENPMTGQKITIVTTYLDNKDVMNWALDEYPELAPLFEHYRDDILNTILVKEVPEDEEGDGDGDGDGEGDDQEGEGQEGEGKEGEGKPQDAKSRESKQAEAQEKARIEMKKSLEDIKEQVPYKFRDSLSEFSAVPKFVSLDPKKYSSDYEFKPNEVRDAENLLKLLDISFDPKSDVVKSLRAGKLDVCKIAEVPAGSTAIYKQIVEDQDTRPFTVCILADMSGSMGHSDYGGVTRIKMQKHVLNSLYLALSSILPEDKLWIYGHSGEEEPLIYPFCTPYDTNYARNIRHYDAIDMRQNYDGPVIEAIHKKLREVTDDRVIFVMLSDGQPSGDGYGSMDDIIDMKRILEKAKRDEFVTVGIGIQYHSVEGLYVYSKVVEELKTMVRDVSHVINNVVRAEFK